MFKFTYETVIESDKELIEELKTILFRLERCWPLHLSPKSIEGLDKSYIKCNGGDMKYSIVYDKKLKGRWKK